MPYNFPFRPNGTAKNGVESSFVEWIRDHSSYLMLGRLATKLGSFASYLGGLVRNGAVLLPLLLLLAIGQSYCHFWLLDHPLLAACGVGLLVGIVLNLVAAWVWWSSGGRPSRLVWTVWSAFATIIGWFVLGILVAAFIVFSAFALEWVRDQFRGEATSLMGVTGLMLTALTAAPSLISRVRMKERLRSKIQAAVIGSAGFILLWSLMLWLTHTFLYGNPFRWIGTFTEHAWLHDAPQRYLFGWPLLVLSTVGLLTLLYRIGRGDWMTHLLSFAIFAAPAVLLAYATFEEAGYGELIVRARKGIGDFTRPLSPLTSSRLDFEANDETIAENLELLRRQKQQMEALYEQIPRGQPDEEDPNGALTPWAIEYFGRAQEYADTGFELLSANKNRQFQFRQEIARRDREVLIDLAKQRGLPSGASSIGEALRVSIARAYVYWSVLPLDRPPGAEHEAIKEWFESSLSDSKIDELLDRLHQSGPSALKQDEYAMLMGREDELSLASEMIRRNSVFPGSIAYFDSSFDNVESLSGAGLTVTRIREAIRTALARRLLMSLNEEQAVHLIQDPSVLENLNKSEANFLKHLEAHTALAHMSVKELKEVAYGHQAIAGRGSETVDPERVVNGDDSQISPSHAEMAVSELIRRAWTINSSDDEFSLWLATLSSLSRRTVDDGGTDVRFTDYATPFAKQLRPTDMLNLAVAGYRPHTTQPDDSISADRAITAVVTGPAAEFTAFEAARFDVFTLTAPIKLQLYLGIASIVGLLAFSFVDINATAIHGFYRDRLAEAFLLTCGGDGRVTPTPKIRLTDLNSDASVAPYHLVNTAINLQGSSDLRLRDQRCDFFLLSKHFCGGDATTYVSTTMFEASDPGLDLATAMTISAAAASPNMGRFTNPFAVLLMTLLNVRLGYWVPNPCRLGVEQFDFDAVFTTEWEKQIVPRWRLLSDDRVNKIDERATRGRQTVDRNLIGLGFSGGGIRSAALNLGIAQALDTAGVFSLVDYLSTVSGGGYTGSAISVAMSERVAEVAIPIRTPSSEPEEEASGTQPVENGDSASQFGGESAPRELLPGKAESRPRKWRNPVWNLAKEMVSCLHEQSSWVNLSDGGHIENLAAMELLRRRCKLVILGDGEADPEHHLGGFGTLVRLARVELGIKIDADTSRVRISDSGRTSTLLKVKPAATTQSHWAFGRIRYPRRDGLAEEVGFLIYLKASFTGDEPDDVRQYRDHNPAFPHEPTSDQFFSIEQFEAYRVLGQHITESMLIELRGYLGEADWNGPLRALDIFEAAGRACRDQLVTRPSGSSGDPGEPLPGDRSA